MGEGTTNLPQIASRVQAAAGTADRQDAAIILRMTVNETESSAKKTETPIGAPSSCYGKLVQERAAYNDEQNEQHQNCTCGSEETATRSTYTRHEITSFKDVV
ncbi:hypothetical protein YSY43_06830 [Paenibacillus sp. YSY-4.3]